jgi:hypothetical protein
MQRAKIDARSGPGLVAVAVARMQADGFAVVGMLTSDQVETYREAVLRLRTKTVATVGAERFEEAVASGYNELRLPFLLEPVFFDLLADPCRCRARTGGHLALFERLVLFLDAGDAAIGEREAQRAVRLCRTATRRSQLPSAAARSRGMRGSRPIIFASFTRLPSATC